MELRKISPSDGGLWEQAWQLYEDSFPEYERRLPDAHDTAVSDSAYRTYGLTDGDTLAAILFYWDFDEFIFVEHIAVNPTMRGKSIGSVIINDLIAANPGRTLILEIDPPVDDISRRRLGFYKRLGFSETPYSITHPSYSPTGQAHPLDLLSYPHVIGDNDFNLYTGYLHDRILKQ